MSRHFALADDLLQRHWYGLVIVRALSCAKQPAFALDAQGPVSVALQFLKAAHKPSFNKLFLRCHATLPVARFFGKAHPHVAE